MRRYAPSNEASIDLRSKPDLVGTVLFLASPESDFMTGQLLNVERRVPFRLIQTRNGKDAKIPGCLFVPDGGDRPQFLIWQYARNLPSLSARSLLKSLIFICFRT